LTGDRARRQRFRSRDPRCPSLLNGKASLSGDMALRIEKAFGVRMETLMRMQSSFDIAETRKREGKIRLRRVPVWRHDISAVRLGTFV